ncbi:MAG: Minf_1886 family protein [Planctomycetota bacterium]|jgi:uncharacterized repeat protein (TIGR04138 family)
MSEKPLDKIRELVKRDGRYQVEAYVFVFEALQHTLNTLGEERHVSGQELCHGIREKALDSFGPLARCVFRQWGVLRTDDFGVIVFNLIEIGLMGKNDNDRLEDFHDVFDLDEALSHYDLEVTLAG